MIPATYEKKNDKNKDPGQIDRPTKARPTATGPNPYSVTKPMGQVGIDLFDAVGKKLLLTTATQGMPGLNSYSKKITEELSTMFNSFQWPNSICNDRGHSSDKNSKISAKTAA